LEQRKSFLALALAQLMVMVMVMVMVMMLGMGMGMAIGNRKMNLVVWFQQPFVQGFPLGAAVSCELCLHFGQYS
jgi:hypothetical protein